MAEKILIVDDQPGIRLLLEEIMRTEGFETLSAETGKEALDSIHTHDPDLTLVDFNLPVMNGSELLEILQDQHYDKPVIIMTGMTEEEVGESAHLPFVKEIVAKPFNIEDIREIVVKSLG
ncbi:response regulator [Thalassobacillus sp. CUG 92003]|uniref:response regulator n=1 Tax=Thalassobacillus sp. CUG 92003 TaxID=2736641 RepID=UPI0015E6A56D|nr:response regulator [Thalassobacillus sp. CUG 92003]